MDEVILLAKQAIESTYKGLCTVIEYKDIEDEDTNETINKPIPVHEDIPCKLSKKAINSTNQTEVANIIKYAPVLFINPGIVIKAGSKIVVSQHGVTREFEQSGEPFVYETHQEIVLQKVGKA